MRDLTFSGTMGGDPLRKAAMARYCKHAIVRNVGDIMIVELTRSDLIDHDYVDELSKDLEDLVNRSGAAPQLVLSMLQVQFLSSYMVGMLISLKKKIDERLGTLRLADVGGTVREVFRLARLSDVLPIDATTDESLAAMR